MSDPAGAGVGLVVIGAGAGWTLTFTSVCGAAVSPEAGGACTPGDVVVLVALLVSLPVLGDESVPVVVVVPDALPLLPTSPTLALPAARLFVVSP